MRLAVILGFAALVLVGVVDDLLVLRRPGVGAGAGRADGGVRR